MSNIPSPMTMDSFRRYCHSYLASLQHPFQSGSEQLLRDDELETIVAFASCVVRHRVQERRLQDLDFRFQSAFDQYLLTSRAEPGALSNIVERLATLLEPYLKKLVLVCYPRRIYRQQGRPPTPLWHHTIEQITHSLGLATATFRGCELEDRLRHAAQGCSRGSSLRHC